VRKPILKRLSVEHLCPIRSADVEFGDLSILVGPQATGKSIFLQTLKLLIDRDQIHDMFARHNLSFDDRGGAFFDAYYGRGIASGWETTCRIVLNGKPVDVGALTRPTKSRTRHERLFYIPAQRVMSLPCGVSQNFGTFNFGVHTHFARSAMAFMI
jgi:energy-coupling factor transporter ATP-binding protein EcfA2